MRRIRILELAIVPFGRTPCFHAPCTLVPSQAHSRIQPVHKWPRSRRDSPTPRRAAGSNRPVPRGRSNALCSTPRSRTTGCALPPAIRRSTMIRSSRLWKPNGPLRIVGGPSASASPVSIACVFEPRPPFGRGDATSIWHCRTDGSDLIPHRASLAEWRQELLDVRNAEPQTDGVGVAIGRSGSDGGRFSRNCKPE